MTIDTETVRNGAAILDALTSNLSADHPIRVESSAKAKSAVADLYAVADAVDTQAAEIARLREALANLLSVYDGTDQQMTPGQYAKEARAALTPQEQGK